MPSVQTSPPATGSAAFKNITVALLTADLTGVTSSTTLVDATGLTFAIGANETWYYNIYFPLTCSVTGQSKFGITSPSGATGSNILLANGSVFAAAFGSAITVTGTNTTLMMCLSGYVTSSSTAGNVQLQYAQATSDATATKIKASAFLQAWKIA